MELLLATNNAHKVSEIRQILAGLDITLRTLADVGIDDLPETHDTFEGNAIEKAEAAFAATGMVCVADDSGIEVDALGGAPGVYSKRFSPEQTAAANNALLLTKLQGQRDRTARFRCVIALVGADYTATASGACEGSIADDERGEGGFGYDPLFLPDETPGRAMAELSAAEKNAISHRGRAFRQLPNLLEGLTR